ncbi:AAA family ATPase [Streptomyces oryzae]|uniref:AAA family ATPase n=1 Tax=Streptomyces oryzae TaxID=1434886 RepID=A0ABS3X7A9_9ACTN|nr:ATP-binding protein [Streptomyces oryzae]MBO8190971.1 AAA family ATPase [Streptomyces oryzae]
MALLEREAELAAVERGVDQLCDSGRPGACPTDAVVPSRDFGVPATDSGTPAAGFGAPVTDAGPPRTRTGGLLAFTGPAGIGKTTLLRETAARVAARSGTVLYACGGEQEQEVGFHVVRRLLRPLLPALDERELRAELGSWYDLAAPAAGLPAPGGAVVPHPHGVRAALDRLFAHLAVRHAPLAVLVDDVHWADPASLGWLAGFASLAPRLPLLCVLGYDPRELRPDAAGFRAAVDGPARLPFPLAELSTEAVGELVGEFFAEAEAEAGPGSDAHAAADEADAAFTEECRKLTGGNPRAMTELLHRAHEAGLKPHRDSRARLAELGPAAPAADVLHRLENLGPDCVRLCWAVAVLGADATLPFAARVAGLRGEAARSAADRLRGARILEGEPGGADAPVRFTHPSLAGEVYRAIPASIRTALHGQTAAALAADRSTRGSAVRHLLEVHPDGDPALVGELRRAAHAYTAAGAPDAAYRCLGRALREPPAPGDRPAVLYELAAAAFRSDAPAAAVHPLRAALAEPACEGEPRVRAVRLLVRALGRTGHPGEALRTLESEVRRARAPAERDALRAELSLWRALHSVDGGGAGDEDPSLPALRAWHALRRGEPAATVLRHAEEAVAGLSWTDDPWGCEVPALVARTFVHCGHLERAEELLREGIAACERAGLHSDRYLGLARALLPERPGEPGKRAVPR